MTRRQHRAACRRGRWCAFTSAAEGERGEQKNAWASGSGPMAAGRARRSSGSLHVTPSIMGRAPALDMTICRKLKGGSAPPF